MNKFLLLLLLCFFGANAIAQDISVYQDKRGHFYVFEKGVTSKLEHLDMARSGGQPMYKVEGDRVIYVNAQGYTIHYLNGKKTIMDYKDNFDRYKMSNGFLISTENDILSIVDGLEKHTISLAKRPLYAFGEAILVYVDYDERLRVFEYRESEEVGIFDLKSLKASDTSFAFTDDDDQFMFWKNGELQEINIEIPMSFKVGNDFVVYVDEYNSLKLFTDGVLSDLEDYAPQSYRIGDDIFAYVSDQGDFKLYESGELKVLDLEPPKEYRIFENTMYVVDSREFFRVFDRGKFHDMEAYRPIKILMDEGVVAYLDHNGYLWAYYEGEKVQVSDQLVEDFQIQGRVITYWDRSLNAQIYWDGNRY